MRNRTFSTWLVAAGVMCGVGSPSLAQAQTTSTREPMFVGAGLSFARIFEETATGIAADLTVPALQAGAASIGVVGDFSVHKLSVARQLGLLGGGRATFPVNAQVRVFAQMLVGFGRTSAGDELCQPQLFKCHYNGVVWSPGGGTLVRLTDRLFLRGQLDVLIYRAREGRVAANGSRITIGVAFPVGTR
jgi:hypothetical protein